MCYDIRAQLERQLRYAQRRLDYDRAKQIEQELHKLPPLNHVNGFAHPHWVVYTSELKGFEIAQWGLVPFWVKDGKQQAEIWNKTLNARGETLFEKPSFRDSAKNKRCVICIDGFFEHRHYKGKKYPYFIQNNDDKPLIIGGLWSNWIDKETGEELCTFTIVTTQANSLMAKIHNNPKLKEGRMPLILTEDDAEKWLHGDSQEIKALIKPNTKCKLNAHTVRKLRGKEYLGNVNEVNEEFIYLDLPELN